jgi:adenine-specific DNA-methyltransferase
MNDKNLGQFYTDKNIAIEVVKMSGILNSDIHNQLIMENSCGDGIFIEVLLDFGANPKNIFAIDIDAEAIEIVRKKFPQIPSENIILGSAFDYREKFKGKFDYVIGNPPYVRIHNLDADTKSYIQNNFNFCKKGMTDLYIAFFELGLEQLNQNGILAYITPNSYVKSLAGTDLRNHIDENNLLVDFKDFNDSKVFEGIDTYTCITILKKNNLIKAHSPWINNHQSVGLKCLNIQNGLATLKDSVFIKKNFDEFNIEPGIIKPIYKASKQKTLMCIYPYLDGVPMTEEYLKTNFPNAYLYLLSHKEILLKRDSDKNSPWYAFGRSQGIKNMDKEKIAISTINPYGIIRYKRLPETHLVYSGIFAVGNLDEFERQLNSDLLIEYISENGTPKSGGYITSTTTLWKKF